MSLLPSRSQWQSWSLPSKLTAIGTLLALISFGLYALEKSFSLKELVINEILESRYSKVPKIAVKIQNAGDKIINVYMEGEFLLWLPQGINSGIPTIPGRYRLTADARPHIKDGLIVIQPSKEVIVAAELMNPQYFSRLLEKGDTDLSLIFRKDDGSSFFSEDIPFRRDTIEKYYTVAIAKKEDKKK